ncbi:MAG TPA: histidine--tRNA ligase [Burkholderiales bacterium]|nr:histidine--tRNA ligase [Burkholderiales bacterium]
MEKVKPALLKGFDQEFLPGEQLQFNALVDSIRRSFELFGFLPIETPSAERREILTSKGGMEKEIYAITRLAGDPGDTESSRGALHFDLTVPLARYVAMREHQLAFPFRRYQIQRVWRGENPQASKGRFREFYQCDIDIIGKGELGYLAEAEIPSVIYRVFSGMNIGPFRIRLNNRKLLKGLLQHFGVSEAAAPEVFRIMDKAEKEEHAKTLEDLGRQGLAKDVSTEILRLITHRHADIFGELSSYAGKNDLCAKGLEELKAVVSAIRQFDVPDSAFGVDLGVVRGLDYYTGTIYETTLIDHPELGSICSGGRYDDLAGYFTNTKLPGVGISIGLSRLFSRMKDANLLKPLEKTPAEVLVTVLEKPHIERYIKVANQLRKAGINTELYLEDKALGKQLEYASKKGFRLAVVAGGNEFGRDAVQLKNLLTKSQAEVNLGGLVEAVRAALKG